MKKRSLFEEITGGGNEIWGIRNEWQRNSLEQVQIDCFRNLDIWMHRTVSAVEKARNNWNKRDFSTKDDPVLPKNCQY